jgi:hypothetical protein
MRPFLIPCLKQIPFTSIQFPLYESFKAHLSRRLNRKPLYAREAAVCGSIAGGIAAAVTTPLDVLKTRVMLDLRVSMALNLSIVALIQLFTGSIKTGPTDLAFTFPARIRPRRVKCPFRRRCPTDTMDICWWCCIPGSIRMGSSWINGVVIYRGYLNTLLQTKKRDGIVVCVRGYRYVMDRTGR